MCLRNPKFSYANLFVAQFLVLPLGGSVVSENANGPLSIIVRVRNPLVLFIRRLVIKDEPTQRLLWQPSLALRARTCKLYEL